MKKKITIITTLIIVILIIIVLYVLYHLNYIEHKKYTNKDFNIMTYKSNIDKDEEIFGDIVKLRSRKIGNFELYRILKKASIELEGLKSTYPEIDKSDEIKKIIKEIKDIDAKVDNSTDYYNDNITTYNTLIKKFPSNIVAMLCKYKEKLFFDRKDMSDEDYDDFKL